MTYAERLDRLVLNGGLAARACAPGPAKRWASAAGVSRSRASRHRAGDPNSVVSRYLQTVYELAAGERTTPWPLIAEGVSTVILADLERLSLDELHAREQELSAKEVDLERDARLATMRGGGNDGAAADLALAALLMERATVRRLIVEKMEKAGHRNGRA